MAVMSFLRRLFFRQPIDPTLGWPCLHTELPGFNMETLRLGSLAFGDPIDAIAPVLGRPGRFQWVEDRWAELIFPEIGLEIDVETDGIVYFGVFLGEDFFVPDVPGFRFAQPRVIWNDEKFHLTSDWTRSDIENRFGLPVTFDEDDCDETILYYAHRSVAMEFEIAMPENRLKRWNLFPVPEDDHRFITVP